MNKVRVYIRKNLGDGSECAEFMANIFIAPTEWDGNEMKTFLGDQVFFSCGGGSDPDFGAPISCRSGDRQSMGQKKPVDVYDEENARGWIITQSDVPVRPPLEGKDTPKQRGRIPASRQMFLVHITNGVVM